MLIPCQKSTLVMHRIRFKTRVYTLKYMLLPDVPLTDEMSSRFSSILFKHILETLYSTIDMLKDRVP